MKAKIFLVVVIFALCVVPTCFAQEQIRLSTYYPAPLGEYDDLSVNSMAVGSGYDIPANDGDLVIEGNVGIGTTSPDGKFNIQGGNDVNASAGGFIITGDLSSTNIGMDDNEIQARNNGIASALYLQHEGGKTVLNKGGGNVGIGVSNPLYKLHVGGNCFFEEGIYLTGTPGNNQVAWRYGSASSTALNAIKMGPSPDYNMQFVTGGNYHMILQSDGTLKVTGNIVYPAGALPDYVFGPEYKLETIDSHAKFMWKNGHLPAVKPAQKNQDGEFLLNVSDDRNQMLEELEKAHIYIEQLNDRLQAVEAKLIEKK